MTDVCNIPGDCYAMTTTSNGDSCADYCFDRGYAVAMWSADGTCSCCCPL